MVEPKMSVKGYCQNCGNKEHKEFIISEENDGGYRDAICPDCKKAAITFGDGNRTIEIRFPKK